MAIRYRAPRYLALIDGAFTDEGVWFIDIVLLVDPPPEVFARAALVRDAKRAILLGVIEETRRGRALGARTIQVREAPDIRRARLQPLPDGTRQTGGEAGEPA